MFLSILLTFRRQAVFSNGHVDLSPGCDAEPRALQAYRASEHAGGYYFEMRNVFPLVA